MAKTTGRQSKGSKKIRMPFSSIPIFDSEPIVSFPVPTERTLRFSKRRHSESVSIRKILKPSSSTLPKYFERIRTRKRSPLPHTPTKTRAPIFFIRRFSAFLQTESGRSSTSDWRTISRIGNPFPFPNTEPTIRTPRMPPENPAERCSTRFSTTYVTKCQKRPMPNCVGGNCLTWLSQKRLLPFRKSDEYRKKKCLNRTSKSNPGKSSSVRRFSNRS